MYNNRLIQHIQQINNFEKDWKLKTNLNKFAIIHLDNKRHPPINIDNKKTEAKTESNMLDLLIKKTGYASHTTVRAKHCKTEMHTHIHTHIHTYIHLD